MVITQVAPPYALLLLYLYVSVYGCQTLCSGFVVCTAQQECMSKHFGHHQGNMPIPATSADQPLYLLLTICAAVRSKQHLVGVR